MYAYRFNTRYVRSGTLWESRYWSRPIQSERHLLTCSRYIELNPVRAGMAKDPGDYRWSSYRGNAMCVDDSLLTRHDVYETLGRTRADRAATYAGLFSHVMDEAALDAIRRPQGRRRRLEGGPIAALLEHGQPA